MQLKRLGVYPAGCDSGLETAYANGKKICHSSSQPTPDLPRGATHRMQPLFLGTAFVLRRDARSNTFRNIRQPRGLAALMSTAVPITV
jgi:hypothetical protein